MNLQHPLVSVIVLTYNHEEYIRQALDSILSQNTTFPYEVIIGDDASTDKTQEIIFEYQEKYVSRIRTIFNPENLGPTRNSYNLLKMARGKYIANLEGDDFWIDDYKLQKQIDFLENNDAYIGHASKFLKVSEDGNPIIVRYAPITMYNKAFTMNDFMQNKANLLFQSSSLMYRNIFLNRNKDYSILYKAHRIIGDGTKLAILLDESDIYISAEQMCAYRVKRKKNASNAVTLMSKKPLEYTKSVLRYADLLEQYFEDKYKFKFFRDIAIDFSIINYKKLEHNEKKEVRHIFGDLKNTDKLSCLLRSLKTKIRFVLFFFPKKIVNWNK